MKSFAKNILALGVTSALSLSAINYSHAATYEVIEVDKEAIGYTYGGKLNINGLIAVSGANSFNFPVQFDYLNDNDFNQIQYNAQVGHDYYFGLEPIEDFDALKAGDPTANDLAWSKMYLQGMNDNGNLNPYYEYQMVADKAALVNFGAGSQSVELCVFDTDFSGSPCTGVLTRSTDDAVKGISDSNVIFGTATAAYLPITNPDFTDSAGELRDFWLRAHGQRGFYSLDNGATILPLTPIYSEYGGGISALFDMNDTNTAVGYSSYKLSEGREEDILDPALGCVEPNRFNVPYDICIQDHQAGMYHIQAFKATISATGELENTEGLGLLVTPHADDKRGFSSQALAVNNNGVAVGYSHGWNNPDVGEPVVNERMSGSYAVIFKEDAEGNKQVFDFNREVYLPNYSTIFSFSRAHDINDSGLVVGYTHNTESGVKKLFYVDTNVPDSEMEMIMPKDFFNTSISSAAAVNSAGVIVGKAEVDTHNASPQNPRRTVGFLYDTASDTPEMINLNDLLTCNSAYDVLEANDINDEGQISATAIVKSKSYDALGEPILDDSGNPVMIDVARAVLLNPIAGEVDDCGSEEDKVERQGASFNGFVLLSLLALFGIRRKKANR
ncbi:DUF3466 family protein [Colwellia piezophila]|uniref:DUF3466 family protein n=1 Tax=Colwellia piezophila TaxID=211668 RepID=UPI0003787344|nr:DUF3466 family protein [Colwellia piezophila]